MSSGICPDPWHKFTALTPARIALGRLDSARNCVSNIRNEGLPPAAAASKLAWLIGEALARQLTGVKLKDDSTMARLGAS